MPKRKRKLSKEEQQKKDNKDERWCNKLLENIEKGYADFLQGNGLITDFIFKIPNDQSDNNVIQKAWRVPKDKLQLNLQQASKSLFTYQSFLANSERANRMLKGKTTCKKKIDYFLKENEPMYNNSSHLAKVFSTGEPRLGREAGHFFHERQATQAKKTKRYGKFIAASNNGGKIRHPDVPILVVENYCGKVRALQKAHGKVSTETKRVCRYLEKKYVYNKTNV